MSAQTEAQRRAAARKAKILARGNAGLARLAQTARGEDADKLYDLSASSPPESSPASPTSAAGGATSAATANALGGSPSSPVSATSPAAPSPTTATAPSPTASASSARTAGSAPGGKPGWANPTPGRTPTPGTRAAAADPLNFMGGGTGGPGGAGMPADMDFGAFMQQMMAGMQGGGMGGPGGMGGFPALGGPGAPGAAGEDPFAGQDPFAALMASMGGAGGDGKNPFAGMPPGMMPPGMGMPGMGMPMAVPPSKLQKFLPLVHALAVLAFTVFVAAWWEPTMQLVRSGGESGVWGGRWGALGGRAGGYAAKTFGHLPVFYAFATLECMLLAFRIVVIKPQPRLHPLLENALPVLPPGIQRLVLTGSKYLGVVGQTYADACLFVFGLGCAVVVAEFVA